MIDRLYDVLRHAIPNIGPDDLADTLWLAQFTRQVPAADQPPTGPESTAGAPEPAASVHPPAPATPATSAAAARPPSDEGAASYGRLDPERGAQLYADPPAEQGAASALPFRTPEAPALPGRLDLARALRALVRRMPSRHMLELDEAATVQRIADAGIWLPALRPLPEPWFEADLVLDQVPSMGLWRRSAEELANLLASHHAFRAVRTWNLSFSGAGQPLLYSGLSPAGGRAPRRVNELTDPEGRRLILLISNGVAAHWRDGRVARLVAVWGCHNPVSLIHVLPEHLWPRTGLGEAVSVQLRAPAPGLANARLQYVAPRFRRGRHDPVLPVLTLEPESLLAWAILTGKGHGAQVPGYLLEIEPPAPPPSAEGAAAPLSGEQRVARFQATASPTALRLAGLLAAAAPLNLHVARLIQNALLPDSRQLHLAEVFLSGLLHRVDPESADLHPDDVRYEFYEGVRERLRNVAPVSDTVQVLQVVSSYISERLGGPGDFRAFLAALSDGDLAADETRRPFASVAARVLASLGGAYADLAGRLAQAAGEAPPPLAAPALRAAADGGPVRKGADPQQPTVAKTTPPAGGGRGFDELEIALTRHSADRYNVDLRFRYNSDSNDIRQTGRATIDLTELRAHEGDPAAYGKTLSSQLFAEPELSLAFSQAITVAALGDATLRLQIAAPSDPELQALDWELLLDPRSADPLLTDERVVFARYLSLPDEPPATLRASGELRALVAVSSPTDLRRYKIAPLDQQADRRRAEEAFASIPTATVEQPVSWVRCLAALREGCDMLYLAARGIVEKGDPYLLLEDERGQLERVSSDTVLTTLRELRDQPRLVLLACDEPAASLIATAIASAGVPVVVTQPAAMSSESVASFLPPFVRELLRDGQADRALAVARQAVAARPDWWRPRLFSRLRNPRIWYSPGFDDNKGMAVSVRWEALIRGIESSRYTPILGIGMLEPLIGSSRELARRWAEQYGYLGAAGARSDLTKVARALSVNQGPSFVQHAFIEHIRRELLSRFGDQIPRELHERGSPDGLFAAVAAAQRWGGARRSYDVLAALPVAIYICGEPTSLLAEALRATGKDPKVEVCRWNNRLVDASSVFEHNPDYLPSVEQPLVFHLFGHINQPDSLVLSEDDYFDFLSYVSANREVIPPAIRSVLADGGLLFLGFPATDLNFRVLFRSVDDSASRRRRRRYLHVAVQDPTEAPQSEGAIGAERYLERYFDNINVNGDTYISVYWGSPDDFCRELSMRLGPHGSDRKELP